MDALTALKAPSVGGWGSAPCALRPGLDYTRTACVGILTSSSPPPPLLPPPPSATPGVPSRSLSCSRSLTLLGQVAQVIELPGEGAVGGVVARHRLVGTCVPPRAAPGSSAPRARAVIRRTGNAGGGTRQQQQEQRLPGPRALPGRPRHRCAQTPQPGRSGRSGGAAGTEPGLRRLRRRRRQHAPARPLLAACAAAEPSAPSASRPWSAHPRWGPEPPPSSEHPLLARPLLLSAFPSSFLSPSLPISPTSLHESPPDTELALLDSCYSKCPRTGSISIPKELVTITEYHHPTADAGIRICILPRSPGNSNARLSLRSAPLEGLPWIHRVRIAASRTLFQRFLFYIKHLLYPVFLGSPQKEIKIARSPLYRWVN